MASRLSQLKENAGPWLGRPGKVIFAFSQEGRVRKLTGGPYMNLTDGRAAGSQLKENAGPYLHK
jgi:hypothetical protein